MGGGASKKAEKHGQKGAHGSGKSPSFVEDEGDAFPFAYEPLKLPDIYEEVHTRVACAKLELLGWIASADIDLRCVFQRRDDPRPTESCRVQEILWTCLHVTGPFASCQKQMQ
eukprot:624967-Rhodomonas_salina.4